MTPTEQKLRDLLNELFRFDRSDLDFGIYRIMNLKRDQVQHFIDVDLLPQIRQVLERTGKEQNGDIETQLNKAREAAKAAGLTNPNEAPKVKELLGKYKAEQSIEEQERQVFSHLFEFFRRYYKDGDFIPQARYKKGVYTLPYEGEEVKLSWANQDQYYIKTSEELRDYSFTLSDKRLVHFRIIQADGDRDNNKIQQGKDRRLILASGNPITQENGELVVRFEYRPDEGTRKQDEINDATVAAVIANSAAAKWKLFLQAQKSGSDKGVLAYHLRQYTARNTFDYFIHKDLGGFLRRELDFYLKNEVLDFDTLAEQGAEQSLQRQFGVARAVQQVGGKVIDFLAQLENFQKKLWLKKKFVVRTDWCVTLDRVPHELYNQVAANTQQIEEWKHLFAVQDIESDTTTLRFTEIPSIHFLEHNPYLVVDTRFFGVPFKDKLLASFSNLDEKTDGLLIHSENFQALELLQERYHEQVKCVYVDPPYNTGNDGFCYRDNYAHSSWLSMIQGRLCVAVPLLSSGGNLMVSVDDIEVANLRQIGCNIGIADRFMAQLVWKSRQNKDNRNVTNLSVDHEYVLAYGTAFVGAERDLSQYSNPDNDPRGSWASANMVGLLPEDQRPNCHYDLIDPATGINYGKPPLGWRYDRARMARLIETGCIIWPSSPSGRPRRKSFSSELGSEVTGYSSLVGQGIFTRDGTRDIDELFGERQISFPKPCRLIAELVHQAGSASGVILDHFAGSGTTAHAVINLNREDGGNRKYVLVEMGDYFDTVLKPRIEKVIYSKDWKDGKPISRDGSSHMFKYMTLESYDDMLANLQLKPEGLFEGASQQVHEQYMLRYMLETETQGSPSLLNTAAFDNPSAYTLKVVHGPETVETAVDLVETFNYLIGLRVRKVDLIRGIRVVQGVSPTGERVLVLWRSVHNTNADQLNDWFTKQGYNTHDTEFDVIYVNGDNHLQNLRRADQTWKVRLIEPEFQRLMFDVQDV